MKVRTFILSAFFSLGSLICFSQQKAEANPRYTASEQTQLLADIFPVDEILSVSVTNNYGTHTLTNKELTQLKDQLLKAKAAGNLLVKPGHISLEIKLKTGTLATAGYAYATTGEIHFSAAKNKKGEYFNNSFYLPSLINFDNYR